MTFLQVMFGFSRRMSTYPCQRLKSYGSDHEIQLTFLLRGVPHSIQALGDGVEFLLVFDQGDFDEDKTFLATEVFLHTPVRPIIPY
jgi:hypothetical protein